ncbi:hypothetical protein [Algivirga pacifica]
MNKYTTVVTSALVVGSMALTNCAGLKADKVAKNQELTIKPSPLELHGDSVIFNANAKLPAKLMKEGYTYDLDVQFNPSNGEPIEAGTISFVGNDFAGSEAPAEMNERLAFAYNEEIGNGQLEFLGRVSKEGSEKTTETNKGTFAAVPGDVKGVITTSRLAAPTFMAVYADHGYNTGEEYEPQYVDFYFLKNSAALRYSEKNGEMGKKLKNYVSEKNPTKTVTITGSHSPEGPTDINTKLANQRPAAVEKYYDQLQSKYRYSSEEKPQFVTKPVVENWSAFRDLLTASDKFTDAEKDEILSIVNGAGDFVSKELKLQSLSSYKKMLRYVYPPLRNAKAEILKLKEKKEPAVIYDLAKKMANGQEGLEALSNEELLFAAAELTPSLDEKKAIYETVLRKGENAVAYNNLGAVMFEMAKKEEGDKQIEMIKAAVPHFESAAKMGADAAAEASANLAGAHLMLGDLNAAEAALANANSSSASVTAATNAVKGYAAIRAGKYDEAINYLSSAGNDADVLYNKALAYTLKASKDMSGDYSQAAAALKEAKDANDSAKVNYLAAIVAARQGDAAALTTALTAAIAKDSAYAEKAVTDLEFVNFKDAVMAASK